MATLDDIAKLAGVSPTTVSRVINNYGSLSEKTKTKVFAAMKELNYQPNSLARSLKGKKTHLIGVILPGVSNPFFGQMVQEIEDQLFKKGFRMILCNAGSDSEKERAYLRMLMANRVDGIIAGSHNLGIEEYQKVGLPIISFDRYLSENIPIVSSDNYHGGQLAAQALLASGSEHFQIITGANRPNSPTNARLTGFKDTLAKRDRTFDLLELRFSSTPNIKGLKIKEMLLKKNVDGIFCTDDLTALLVIQQARELGIKIPENIRLIGYDGTRFIQNYHPELTTIMQPIADIVTMMIDLLLKRIDDHECQLEDNYVLPVKLITGETTI
ncbi:LacI family DNA-binding transcriptional regulator [Companilactobacillus alimentarius]|uniref:LacI family transcriptional regulator n=2 Tax=Companilactobacillus alimentarius TaxID=1602 RepID=A0A2K9HL53_9LACO|nr:LacI family transcriptional regulator [Companilactobacillus alimentarius DSM 20249]KRK78300.1 sucrose operon repressor [Companilactobacillus alimentarius DSM 20249]GEO44572.1 LacI family transcriptional regulator [Companilactobacillus alimentarius]